MLSHQNLALPLEGEPPVAGLLPLKELTAGAAAGGLTDEDDINLGRPYLGGDDDSNNDDDDDNNLF
jgi:hypothetical protein